MKKSTYRSIRKPASPRDLPPQYLAEVPEGTEKIGRSELQALGKAVRIRKYLPGEIHFEFGGSPKDLLQLRSIHQVFLSQTASVPRPQTLLGDEWGIRLLKQIEQTKKISSFTSFRIAAAGKDSSVFQRLCDFIEQSANLSHDAEGDMIIRFRKHPLLPGSWEILTRISPRPLSVRTYRSQDWAGALNGALAGALIRMLGVESADSFLNFMCGSGTLLIEQRRLIKTRATIGIDINEKVLRIAQESIERSGHTKDISLLRADVRKLPFPSGHFHSLVGDLPWGERIGARSQNGELYRDMFSELTRVAKPQARLGILTQHVQPMEEIMGMAGFPWKLLERLKVFQGGFRPEIFLFEKIPANKKLI